MRCQFEQTTFQKGASLIDNMPAVLMKLRVVSGRSALTFLSALHVGLKLFNLVDSLSYPGRRRRRRGQGRGRVLAAAWLGPALLLLSSTSRTFHNFHPHVNRRPTSPSTSWAQGPAPQLHPSPSHLAGAPRRFRGGTMLEKDHCKHRKNYERCQSQVTWKVKFKCQFCPVLSCPGP